MLFDNVLAQKIESFILQNKTMRRKLDKFQYHHESPPFPRKQQNPPLIKKAAPVFPSPKLEKRPRTYETQELGEISEDLKKIKILKENGFKNLVDNEKNGKMEEEKANHGGGKNEKNGKHEKKPVFNNVKTRRMEEELVRVEETEKRKESFKYTYSYVENDRKKMIEITDYDLKTLEVDKFLNDTIINFFLKFIENELTQREIALQTHIFSTYFVSKLMPFDVDSEVKLAHEEFSFKIDQKYREIMSWVKIDIFSKDFLVFPIHKKETEHWAVIIICFPKNIPFNLETNREKPVFILYFDSFGMIDENLLIVLRYFLAKEYYKKFGFSEPHQKIFNISQNLSPLMPFHQILVPRQDNFTDCGLYLLTYVEMFLNNPNDIIDDKIVTNSKLDWFPLSLAKKKRTMIKEIIEAFANPEYPQNKTIITHKYLKERENLLKTSKMDTNEYPPFDKNGFEKYIRTRSFDLSEDDEENQLHLYRLKYYYNPDFM